MVSFIFCVRVSFATLNCLCDSKLFFTNTVLHERNSEYSKKQEEGKVSEKAMMSLVWDVKQLTELDDKGRQLKVNCQTIKDHAEDEEFDWIASNMAAQLCNLRKKMECYVHRVSRFRRTHILVIMISPEERNLKPYAMPIQCIPYAGLGDMQVRSLIDKVVEEMKKRGMKIAGVYFMLFLWKLYTS